MQLVAVDELDPELMSCSDSPGGGQSSSTRGGGYA
jgi:hypothetical protein